MVTTRSMKGEQKPEPTRSTVGEQKPELRTYRGNCHCGAFVYEVELPEIKSVLECNCSICHKKGYLWVFPAEGRFDIVKGTDDTLTRYTFGPKKLTHRVRTPPRRAPTPWHDAYGFAVLPDLCHPCHGGIRRRQQASLQRELARSSPISGKRMLTGALARFALYRVSTAGCWRSNRKSCIGIDRGLALTNKRYDGAALGDEYVPPEHKGPLPAAIDGHELYTGSCHCGAVTLAFMSKKLDETFTDLTCECNCSICGRNGYRWTYPSNKRVVLFAGDPAHLGRYSFARHVLNKTFCRICGVCMTNEYSNITDEERKALGALPARGFANSMKTQHPVNLRVFPDVDLDNLKPPKLNDGAKIISPRYVNP
ncbi:Glutathione-dependent formaldehyde-activating enzyme [Tolypocladium paradoxum]|uniref:Glutathione-dependent formaldehyde-activating enzyme n=1 Tax=Tolypocladium paradoxum TaxID=94208 RepID=A0A2S4KYT3_9HYPO|nr:Glutathione-dependent formaldehyde-activating enzyme [Tolypocladium paradoxum]